MKDSVLNNCVVSRRGVMAGAMLGLLGEIIEPPSVPALPPSSTGGEHWPRQDVGQPWLSYDHEGLARWTFTSGVFIGGHVENGVILDPGRAYTVAEWELVKDEIEPYAERLYAERSAKWGASHAR